jgi:hypothetical protein
MLAAPVAAMVVHWLFVYVIPAKCPACRGRVRCEITLRPDDSMEFATVSAITYRCRACGFDYSRDSPPSAIVSQLIAAGPLACAAVAFFGFALAVWTVAAVLSFWDREGAAAFAAFGAAPAIAAWLFYRSSLTPTWARRNTDPTPDRQFVHDAVGFVKQAPAGLLSSADPYSASQELDPEEWTPLATKPQLPKTVEVEELAAGVRYWLPAEAVVMLDRCRLRGWSGNWGRSKCSRPVQRVRRLLVWQMGIWLESDGWRPRAVLLASYDVANPPDPQLLVWVAYDLAKRIGDLPTCSTRPVVLVHEKLVSALEF